MLRLLVLLLSLTFVLGSPVKSVPRPRLHGSRIIGGEEAKDGEFPYTVSVNWDVFGHLCGASILTSQWILTSASCCELLIGFPFYVYAGSNNNNADGIRYEVEGYIVHEDFNYTSKSLTNDICLLKLGQKMELNDRVKQIVIPYQGMLTKEGEKTTFSGWGLTTNDTNQTIPEKLLVGRNYSVLSNEECGKLSGVNMDESFFCTLPEEGHGTCGGDNGGPLVTSDNVQIGISSWMVEPCGSGKPEFFTKNSHFTDWIIQNLGDDSKELRIAQKS